MHLMNRLMPSAQLKLSHTYVAAIMPFQWPTWRYTGASDHLSHTWPIIFLMPFSVIQPLTRTHLSRYNGDERTVPTCCLHAKIRHHILPESINNICYLNKIRPRNVNSAVPSQYSNRCWNMVTKCNWKSLQKSVSRKIYALVCGDMTEPTVYPNQSDTTVYCIQTRLLSYNKQYKNYEPNYIYITQLHKLSADCI